jgi:hypothetical protein
LVLLNQFQKPVFSDHINHILLLPIHNISCKAAVKTTIFFKVFFLSVYTEIIALFMMGGFFTSSDQKKLTRDIPP